MERRDPLLHRRTRPLPSARVLGRQPSSGLAPPPRHEPKRGARASLQLRPRGRASRSAHYEWLALVDAVIREARERELAARELGVSTDVIPVDPVSAIAPYGAPPIVVDGGEGAEDAASEASDGQLVDVGAEGGGVADTGTAAAADGATIDAEGDAGGAD